MTFATTTHQRLVIEIAPSDLFLVTLNRENKRSERSGRPFILALINGDCLRDGGQPGLARRIATAISSCTRETDSVGWYEQGNTLGVLLTEIGSANDAKVELLVRKISLAIQQTVAPEEFCRLRLAIRILPHGAKDGDCKDDKSEPIYPDFPQIPETRRQAHAMKRVIDVLGSCLFLLLLLPIFMAIALLVMLTSEGPVIFCQKRVGRYGKLFNFYKFRTMHADSDHAIHREYVARLIEGTGQVQQPNGMYKLAADPRITPLGRILRKTSLDELPQFVNVLRGDMSLVGPRPPLPYEFDRYRAWHRRRVMEIKPGLTGLWQVYGRSRTTFDEMVRMDLRYARTQSLWLDLKIILQTPAAMFIGRGAC
jgi:lipopolysaccharide/colanic/teichoic acid biosynthesis glycosyltransferase